MFPHPVEKGENAHRLLGEQDSKRDSKKKNIS